MSRTKYTIAFVIEVDDDADESGMLDAAIEALPDLVGHLEAVCIEATIADQDVSVAEFTRDQATAARWEATRQVGGDVECTECGNDFWSGTGHPTEPLCKRCAVPADPRAAAIAGARAVLLALLPEDEGDRLARSAVTS